MNRNKFILTSYTKRPDIRGVIFTPTALAGTSPKYDWSSSYLGGREGVKEQP